MIVATPGANTGTNTDYTYNKKKSTNYVHYYQLISSRSISSESHRLCYLMKTRNTNMCLWYHNIELRDNGVLTMVIIFRILASSTIITYTTDSILMRETQFPAIIAHHLYQIQKVNKDNEIKANDSQAMLHNKVHLNINKIAPKEFSFSGLFCNKNISRLDRTKRMWLLPHESKEIKFSSWPYNQLFSQQHTNQYAKLQFCQVLKTILYLKFSSICKSLRLTYDCRLF